MRNQSRTWQKHRASFLPMIRVSMERPVEVLLPLLNLRMPRENAADRGISCRCPGRRRCGCSIVRSRHARVLLVIRQAASYSMAATKVRWTGTRSALRLDVVRRFDESPSLSRSRRRDSRMDSNLSTYSHPHIRARRIPCSSVGRRQASTRSRPHWVKRSHVAEPKGAACPETANRILKSYRRPVAANQPSTSTRKSPPSQRPIRRVGRSSSTDTGELAGSEQAARLDALAAMGRVGSLTLVYGARDHAHNEAQVIAGEVEWRLSSGSVGQ